ncbi:hypothetical protein Dimus_011697 [Dionaea muscipula]
MAARQLIVVFEEAGRMSTQQMQKPNSDQSLITFEDVSKFFSLPLSEAADILGVSTSVLKTICNDNGLERWPHRKYLAGKSIEDIKIEAAKEKSKAGLSKVDKQKSSAASNLSSSIGGSQSKDRPVAEPPRSQGSAQQSVSRNVYTWRSQSLLNSGFIIETSTGFDEFKYGFPSNGLSTHTNKWWGSGSPDDAFEDNPGDESETGQEEKHKSPEHVDNVNECKEKADGEGNCAVVVEPHKVTLSALRKQAAEEARKAVKLGIWKECGVDDLGKNPSVLLSQLFKNS